MTDDNRLYPRFPVSLETIYFCQDGETADNDRMYFPGTITNKSQGGIGMVVSYPHKPADLLWLEGLGGSNEPIAGHVRWTMPRGQANDLYDIGIEFAAELAV